MRQERGPWPRSADGSSADPEPASSAARHLRPIAEGGPDPEQSDRAASDAARRWYRRHQMEPLEADARVGALLGPDEAVFVTCQASLSGSGHGSSVSDSTGDLYVTSRRLLHLGAAAIVVDLDRISEVVVRGGGLVITTTTGDSMRLTVEAPRLLRVQIAAARIARRPRRGPSPMT